MSIKEKVCVKVLVSMLNYAASQIAKFNSDFKNKLKGLNEIIQWKIGEDIAYCTEIYDENIRGFEGETANPSITFEISDVSGALNLLTGRADISALTGKIKISGDASKIQQLSFIMETVREYMEDLSVGG
jgi:hypothetical protein